MSSAKAMVRPMTPATRPVVLIRDQDGDDDYIYLAEGWPGLPVAEAVERVDAAIRAAKTAPADPETGYVFEDLERELTRRGLALVEAYESANERW